MPDPVEVEALLDAGDEAALLGESETEHLDFKEQPYVLNTDKGKWELAKDVAALANSGGGCLVIGVSTDVPPDSEDEVAGAIKPFPQERFDVQQVRAALDAASGVYPVIKGVAIRKFSRAGDKALALVRVPPQAEDDQPFMTVRMVEGDEKRGVGIGVPFRSGPHTYWTPPGQLHRDLSDGRRARSTPPPLASPPTPAASPVQVKELVEQRLTAIEQYMGWSEAPTLLLAAVPTVPQTVPIEGFYDPSGIYGCAQSPPEIRHAGFGLAWPSEPENVDGSLINASADRQVLWVDPDGSVFAAATGKQSFLTRSGGSRIALEPEPRVINPTVLVEWTYLFFKFVADCVSPSVSGSFRNAVRLRGAQSRPWSLRMVGGSAVQPWTDGRPPGMDELAFFFSEDGEPGRHAFRALTSIYGLFGLPPSSIPYTDDSRIDPGQIQAIR